MNQGYRVLAASNGEEALTIVEKVGGVIDLVLTDVVMPDMGGPDLIHHLDQRWPGVRVVYMSGYAEGDKIRGGMQDRDSSFLQKPFSAESLVFTVRQVLDRTTNKLD